MKRFYHLLIVLLATVSMTVGCQKYDDSELRREIQELREKLASLETWSISSQSAIDAVAFLQDAVKNMNSVESIEQFTDADGATGYVITFTDKETIKLHNGKNGDTVFRNVVVNDDCIIFTLADGSKIVVPIKQDNADYLYFEAVESGATVSLEIVGSFEAPRLKYSTNKIDWIDFDFNNPVTLTLANAGDKVYWRNADKAETFTKDKDHYVHFVLGERKITAGGNIMSLVDSTCTSKVIPSESCFMCLFLDNASLIGCPQLPATELQPKCYCSMFYGCSSLVLAPELPATELQPDCYFSMFYGCSSLKKAPELPATELETACYAFMFSLCSSLEEAPALPALKLANQCYYAMFQGCDSFITAPELPATELKYACYYAMFLLCQSLENVPALPAMKLEPDCYYEMFAGCHSLEKAPDLPATELATGCYSLMFFDCYFLIEASALPALRLADNCYEGMFRRCESLETAPELPAHTLAENCYSLMFYDCQSLNEIKVGFEDWREDIKATDAWVYGVGYEGTFECPEGLEIKYGESTIPTGWSVKGVAPASLEESLAATAIKSIGDHHLRPTDSKTPKIHSILDIKTL